MPGPPPPPPAAPPPMMPPPVFSPLKGGADDRGALLKSIQKGAKLKKTVTNDKSGPIIPGKISNNNTKASPAAVATAGGGSYSSGVNSATPNGLGLGGLFAGGMPKLRPTGKLGASSNLHSGSTSNNNNIDHMRKPEVVSPPSKNFSSIQNELKKQLASDNRNRGPPPPAPIRNIPDDSSRQPFLSKLNNSNGVQKTFSSTLQINSSTIQANSSTLHRKTKSNANLSTLDSSYNVNNCFNNPPKPVINHGKPNVAPKPPALNGKPMAPPKKLLINGKPVSRAHSMKSPRAPSPQSPDNPAVKFGTVRNMSSIIGQSLANSTGNLSPRPRPALNGRPSAPPPSVPNHQAPPPPPHMSPVQNPLPALPSKLNVMKPPNHAPPPPPGFLPQPPNHPPPLPPHKTQPVRAPPAVPGSNAPPPPPRNSSMREAVTTRRVVSVDLEEKFAHLFQSPDKFPRPPSYRNVIKIYSNKQVVNKQQAPQPPHIQPPLGRTWDPKAC